MDNKTLKKGYVELVGSSATEVTGSAALVRFMNYHILVDYGMRQSSKQDEDYQINSKRHKSIKPKKLDAIILTHVHLDHSGLIPALYKDGCDCPCYVPNGTKRLLTLMWQDSVKIFLNDQERLGRIPLYEQGDVDCTLKHIIECDLGERITINENVSFQSFNAQHIVRSRQIMLYLHDGATEKRVGFTGDWSGYGETYYLTEKEDLPPCDVVIAEATYGDNKRLTKSKDRRNDINKLDMAIKYALEHKSKVIIPTLSLHRLQLLLAILYEMYDGKAPIKILVDSPLGKNISGIWEHLIDKDFALWQEIKYWDNVYWTEDFNDTVHFDRVKEPMLVLAGGAFLQGGRATYWVKKNLDVKNNYIVFCSYSSPESPAGQIKSGTLSEIKIDGATIRNRANILTLNSFSSHADKKRLLEYYSSINCNKIVVVHSNKEYKLQFVEDLKNEISKVNKTTKIVNAEKNIKIHL